MNLPWLTDAFQAVESLWPSRPHALCLVHPTGVPIDPLRDAMTRAWVCAKQQFPACGQCASCLQGQNEAHPDVLSLVPEGAAGMIPVDSVRHVISVSQSTPSVAPARVIQVRPANALNTASANALLKWVEEPPAGTVWLFETAWPGKLLPTLVSRLRMIRIAPPTPAQWASFAESAGVSTEAMLAGQRLLGEPLAVHQSIDRFQLAEDVAKWMERARQGEDPVMLAALCQKKDPKTVLQVVTSVVQETIEKSVRPETQGECPDTKWLVQVLDRVAEVRRQAESNIAVNLPMAMSVLFASWAFVWTKVQAGR